MAAAFRALPVLAFCLLCLYTPTAFGSSSASSTDFLRCLSSSIPSNLFVTQSSPSFTSILVSSIKNPRFFTPSTVRPLCIVTPTNASDVQSTVLCGRRHGVRIRVRSGGHDYEGLSYRSVSPGEVFAVVDLANLRSVRVNSAQATAWVDSGATVGELYHAVAKGSNGRLAFPAGLCPTIGVGGHFSGGGFGLLQRKYGIAVDHVINAVLVDAGGRLLDKNAMGRDVFWAIRGGGGESFGIVLSWQVKLVPVPPKVTAFIVPVTVDHGAVDILTKWQVVAPALPDDVFVRVLLMGRTASFQGLYLGTCEALLPVMRSRFPELGMNRTHCREVSWVESVLYVYVGSGDLIPEGDILNRTIPLDGFYKATSDYVRQPISRDVWAEIFTWLAKPDPGLMILDPYGANIGGVPESATPFPHRAGVLYNIQYMNFWGAGDDEGPHIRWIRDLYAFMTPYVSKNPREAYFNYRDLDLGRNVVVGNVSSYEAGKVWGEKYFKGNYKRLALAKGKIDPEDYFRNEQSVPPLVPRR
ncbi:hypothetical protein HU200_062941 [Digitaria exilis]|uniref:FAD-binding PCMH-type domain-containing protein n=1 Tax=Digitaria exilis TaxID=1010633 RepID=A0A835DVF1_9POAL|nr:hypothetical protein HU200_062941 [Digitaria exilis]